MSRITESNELIKRQITLHSEKLDTHEVKIVQVERGLSDFSKAISQLNPNHEAKQSVSGYGVVSLPQNAANSPLSVTVKGRTATNIVENGSFEDGISKWAPWGSGSVSASTDISYIGENSLKVVASDSAAQGYQDIEIPVGNKVYIKAYGNISAYENGTFGIAIRKYKTWDYIADNNFDTNIINEWQSRSRIIVNNTAGIRIILGSTGTSNLSGYIDAVFVVDLTATFGASNEPTVEQCDQMFPHWFDGTKSTLSGRVQIKDAEDNITSEAYYDGILRSLPNGTNDEVNVSSGVKTQNVSGEIVINGTLSWQESTPGSNTYRAVVFGWANNKNIKTPTNNTGIAVSGDGNYRVIGEGISVDTTDKVLCVIGNNLFVRVEKSKISAMEGASLLAKFKAYLNQYPITLTYQLANPIVTTLPAQILTGGANHTVWLLPEIADAGIYTDKITVLNQDLPIKSLLKVSKIDFETGAETALNVATAVIAGDKKSFTHPDLKSGDIVFFEYEYPSELTTTGELTIGYLDSRYVVKGADDNYYTWHVAVDAEGIASLVAEVVE